MSETDSSFHLASWKLPVPWEISDIKPELQFYTSLQKDCVKVPYTEDAAKTIAEIESAGFVPSDLTKIILITHGFENDIETPWLPQMKDEIFKTDPKCLVILLGWGGGAHIGILKYAQASANTQSVAKWLKNYFIGFRKSYPDVFLWAIGHSLGAHLLGLAGRESGALNRISALDPAGPSFEKVNQENRLCKTDAKVVDVIHTDGYDTVFDPADWFAPVNHYGTLIPLGTTDFYPNFGYRQPGISHFTVAGSHHRSIELFMWSINNAGKFRTNAVMDGIPAFEAPVEKVKYVESSVEMGFHFDSQKMLSSGLFYIHTNGELPWVGEKETDAGSRWGFNFCCIS